ncbi:FlxA-like family protein [Clostridium sp.]|uniref:FlxA-like family protein n=1 Tax=Clostridium sp. TaxID=1506 RepID=UPI003463E3CE
MLNSISSSNPFNLTGNYTNNSEIKSLEKQRENIREQIEKTSSDKIPSDVKESLLKSLREQLQQVETQIEQKNMEGLKNKNSSEKNNNHFAKDIKKENNNTNIENVILYSSNIYNNIKSINKIKTSIKGETNILNSEAKLDEARGAIEIAAKKRHKAERNQNSINKLNSKIYEEMNNSNNNIKVREDKDEEYREIVEDTKEDKQLKSRESIDIFA